MAAKAPRKFFEAAARGELEFEFGIIDRAPWLVGVWVSLPHDHEPFIPSQGFRGQFGRSFKLAMDWRDICGRSSKTVLFKIFESIDGLVGFLTEIDIDRSRLGTD